MFSYLRTPKSTTLFISPGLTQHFSTQANEQGGELIRLESLDFVIHQVSQETWEGHHH